MNTTITERYLETIDKVEKRYAERTPEREEKTELIREGKMIEANPPDLVQRRFDRLGIDLGAAKAMLSGGLKFVPSDPGISPQAVPRTLERVLGTNDLIGYGVFIDRLLQRGKAVARIQIKTPQNGLAGYGTGFMISPRLLVTNNHVFEKPEDTVASVAEFNFQSDADGQLLTSRTFGFAPGDFFLTDPTRDFTVVALQPDSGLEEFGWIPLIGKIGKLMVGERVNIIQHPNGEPKQLAIRQNLVVDELELFLHYKTDTAPGSSGSPVFNDQWELVALHHSGVPERDEHGHILTTDGRRWQSWMGEHRIAWKANEGLRASRLVAHLQEAKGQLDSAKARLLTDVLEGSSRNGPDGPSASANSLPTYVGRSSSGDEASPEIGVAAVAAPVTWTIPLKISVSLGQFAAPPVSTAVPTPEPAVSQAPMPGPRVQPGEPEALREALEELTVSATRTYYDAAADAQAATAYYSEIPAHTTGRPLFKALSQRVKSSHTHAPRYRPARELYPWIDLHPDRKLRSIYSGQEFEPEALIREDFKIGQERAEKTRDLMLREADILPERLQYELDLIERSLPYNCEHVIPQSWFNSREPMRGDLHHLFACEARCNSFRSNTPYYDFPDFEEAVMDQCGKSTEGKFEPQRGKGAIARAVLYFLIRYPGQVGDEGREMQQDRLPIILNWHDTEPPDEYERHRNQAIFEKQGNRNPFIDHPEWAAVIDFGLGLG